MEEYEGKRIIILKDNKEVECKVLFTVNNSHNGNDYIIYSDDSYDKDGNINIFASLYNPQKKELLRIDSEEDREMIEMVIEVVREELVNA